MDAELDELIRRFQEDANDDRAVEELRARLVNQVLCYIHSAVRKGPNPAALDSKGLFQAAFRSFLSEVRKPGFNRRQGDVVGMLMTIVMRKLWHEMRKPQPLTVDFQTETGAWNAISAMIEGEWTEQEVQAELSFAMMRVLENYTHRERSIIERFLDPESDQTYLQIAKEKRCTVTAIEDTIDRFQDDLRRMVESLTADSEGQQ